MSGGQINWLRCVIPMTTTDKRSAQLRLLLGFSVLLLFFVWLGMHGTQRVLWWDEYMSVWLTGGAHLGPLPLEESLARISIDRYQTPGYYLLLRGWGTLAGWSDFALHYFTLLMATLTLALLYRLGCTLGVGRRAALLAVLLCAGSVFYMAYAIEARAYMSYVLGAAWVMIAYWRLRQGRGGRAELIALALGTGFLIYMHYYALLTLIPIGLDWLFFAPRRRWDVFGALLVGGLLFLPWLPTAFEDVFFAAGNPGAVRHLALTPERLLRELAQEFSSGSPALLLLLIGAGLRWSGAAYRLLWLWLLAVLGLAMLLTLSTGALFSVRYLLALVIPLALLAALGIERLMQPRAMIGGLALGLWLLGGLLAMQGFFQPFSVSHLPINRYAEALRGEVTLDGHTAFLLPAPADRPMYRDVLDYYAHDVAGVHHLLESPERQGGEPGFIEDTRVTLLYTTRLWVGSAPDLTPLRQLAVLEEALTAQGFTQCQRLRLPDLRLDHYLRLPADLETRWIEYPQGRRAALVDDIPANVLRELSLSLAFALAEDSPRGATSFSLRIVDEAEQILRQWDERLPDEAQSCRSRSFVIDDLPDGEYGLELVLYASETLTPIAPVTSPEDVRVRLGRFAHP